MKKRYKMEKVKRNLALSYRLTVQIVAVIHVKIIPVMIRNLVIKGMQE